MSRLRTRRTVAAVAALIVVGASTGVLAAGALAGSPSDVTTGAYDNLRTGWDPNEPNLSPSDVQSGSFGQVFSTKLEGSIYAQPLAVNGTLIVTTEKARAYGVNSTTGKVQWSRRFGRPLLSSAISCGDLAPDLGSTSTPVIDPATDTVYLTTRLQSGKGASNNHTWLQAISASTGAEVAGFPVEIQGTPDNTPGVPFDDWNQLQRPALLLLGGVVYAAFSSDCDHPPYRGIVVGVSTTTHSITTMWSDEAGTGTDANSQSGIWQSGSGLVSDGPNRIFFTTGNGIAPPPSAGTSPPATLSESVVALTVGSDGKLTPTDYFSPADAPQLDQNDDDFGSGGPVALPSPYFGTTADPNLLVQVGKDGRVFLLNRDDLGGRETGPGGTDNPLQMIGPIAPLWGHPAVFGGGGGWVYIAENDGKGGLQALSYGVSSTGAPQLTAVATSAGALGQGSGSPTVTSNGTDPTSAVVWLVYSGGISGQGAQLRAYGAIPSNGIVPLLWSAPIARASKYSAATAYDGMVYVGTRTGRLFAFGTKSNAPLQAAPVDFGNVPVGTSRTVGITVTANRSTAITGVSPAAGVVDVHRPSNGAALRPGPGYQGSTVVPDTAALGQQNQPFSVRPPAHHRVLAAGQSITIPVTFTPRTAGTVVADITVTSTAGTRTLALTGDGTAPGLILSAPPVSFGVVDTGAGGKTLTFTVANSWDHPETITGLTPVGAPFTVTGLPPVGTVLKPQQAVTASVTYDPTTAGTNAQSVTIRSDHGAVTEPFTGSAVTGSAVLTLTPTALDFGSVRTGTSVTRTFRVANTGTVPLTISRAAPPSGVFSATRPLPEGITLDPGTGVTQAVTFTPTDAGSFSGSYTFDAANGQGKLTVTLTGTATSS